MKNFIREKWFLLVGILAFGVVVVGLAYLYIFLNRGGQDGLGGAPPDEYRVVSITPESSQVLLSGIPATFEVGFSSPVDLSDLHVKLEHFNSLQSSSPTTVAFDLSVNESGDGLVVTTTEPIQTYHVYLLDVSDARTGSDIASFVYESTLQNRAPAPENNLDLAAHLPHETDTYRLVYVPDINTYVFNFKLDGDSTVPALEQYEQAKAQAEEFIRSVRVDPESIVIEWRHS